MQLTFQSVTTDHTSKLTSRIRNTNCKYNICPSLRRNSQISKLRLISLPVNKIFERFRRGHSRHIWGSRDSV